MSEKKSISQIRQEVDRITSEDRMETFDSIQASIEQDKLRTERMKKEFIDTVKYEYGEELKKNPNGATLINQGFWAKLKKRLNKFFEMF